MDWRVEESRVFLRENPDVCEAFGNYLRLTLDTVSGLIAALGLDPTGKPTKGTKHQVWGSYIEYVNRG